MEEKKNVPKRRFTEFKNSPAWEPFELGENSLIITGGTPNTNVTEYWFPKEVNWLSSGEVNKKRITDTDNKISTKGFKNSSAKKVKKGSVLIALAGQGKTRGKAAITEISLTTNQSIASIEPSSNINSEFLFQSLSKDYEKLRNVSSGSGSRGGLNKKLISDYIILCPDLKEQQKIGQFFRQLDHLIELHQQKLQKLKAQKQAYLSEMFPQEGETKPKRRFAGFDGEWEEFTLGELGSVASCKRIYKNQTTEIGEIPFYKIGTFGKKADSYISKKLFEEYKSKFSYPKKGDLLLSASGSIGQVIEYQGEEAYFQDSNIVWLALDARVSNLFLKQFYSIVHWFGLEGSTIKRLYNKNILNTKIILPEYNEQQKIGSFFQKLDSLIEKQEKRVKKYQALKQAYLNEMFV